MPFFLRKAFVRFRCSNHKLSIEIGRHRGIDRADRICIYCFNQLNSYIVEDEYHVFFICSKYKSIQDEFLHTWYQSGDSINDFYNLVNTNSTLK